MCGVGIAFGASFLDSLGVTTEGGKRFILHEVEAGETLFALSRKYRIDVQSIKSANTESVVSLSVGQKILIPIAEKLNPSNGKVHIVSPSETLFSISQQYGVSVDDLKKWNHIADNSLSVGQKLLIENESVGTKESNVEPSTANRKIHKVEQSQTLYSISRMYGVTTNQLKEWNHLTSNSLDLGQVLVVSAKPAKSTTEPDKNSSMLPATSDANSQIKKTTPVVIAPTEYPKNTKKAPEIHEKANSDISEDPVEKVIQKGFAEVIENTSDTKKYLALHRDAPVGTIMQVKNEMNGQSVFVRIVGPIPPTGDNSKLILKLSKKAYDRLGAVDSRFPVELSYIP